MAVSYINCTGYKMKKKLSIIIVSYNKYEILKQCIDSIYKYNDLGDEIEIIISDNSTDTDVFKKICEKYKDVRIIHNEINAGFGYGNNRGYEISTGDYLLFLNPDTYFIEPFFKWAIEKFENDKMLAAFGVKLVDTELNDNFSYGLLDGFGLIDWIRSLFYWKFNCFIEGKMFTSGADLFIRSSVFKKIGCFDENIFMYYEESDVLHRLKLINKEYKMEYFPQKKIIHLEGATQKKEKETMIKTFRIQLKTLKYYCRKYGFDYKKVLRKDIRLYYFRLIKYFLYNDSKKQDFEKEIIKIAKEEVDATI